MRPRRTPGPEPVPDAVPPYREPAGHLAVRRASTTGATRIRAGLPKGWKVAGKTGTGDYGRANDVAIVWQPHTAPLVVAVMSDRHGYGTPPKDALVAEAARQIVATLT